MLAMADTIRVLRPVPPLSSDEDAPLLAQLAAGDERALQALVARHQTSVLRFCASYVREQAVAAELTQEVFLTLWRERRAYQHRGKLRAFLFTTARLRCLNHLRQTARARTYVVEAQPGARQNDRVQGPSEVERGALARELERHLQTLEPEFAEVVALRYLADQSLEEIAELVGHPLGTVKSRLHRALAELRRSMDER